jgi:hypothetical protein
LNLLNQPVHSRRRISTDVVAGFLPILKLNGPLSGLSLMGPQHVTGRSFLIARHMSSAKMLNSLPVDVGRLILEMQEKP